MAEWSEKLKDAWWSIRRNKQAKTITIITLAVCAIGVIGYGLARTYAAPAARVVDDTGVSTNDNILTGITRRHVDGEIVDQPVSNITPAAVMVENLVAIRPQSGLSQANLVYEALVEGGITRFMAVYANEADIVQIGPVRSARPYFVDWAEEYRGLYAYVGGSPEALGVTGSSEFITDLNQYFYDQYYYREPTIEAPHNLFTTSTNISQALQDFQLADVPGKFTTYQFKDERINASSRAATRIHLDFSSDDYAVDWQYDGANNSYLRSDGGQPHLDKNNGNQLTAKNIVVQKVETIIADEDSGRLNMTTIGSGEALIFQDGLVTTAHWTKAKRGDRTTFTTSDGQPVSFNPGTTWLEIMPTTNSVTY